MQQSRFTQKRFSGAATPEQIAELRRLYVDEEKTLKEIAEAVCHTVFDGTISKTSISKLSAFYLCRTQGDGSVL